MHFKKLFIFRPVEVDGENEPAIIVCSSGTTGLSKGVCLSHATLLDQTTNCNVINSSDVVLGFNSLYGITGWKPLLLGTMYGATRIISTQSFSANLELNLIEKYKVTYVYNSPYQLALITKSDRLSQTDLSSLKYLFTGGCNVPVHIKNEMISKMRNGVILTAYGMTESAGAFSMSTNNSESVGQLLSFCTVKIIDEQGIRCDVGENGEICFKTTYRFLGYYGNQKVTDESFDEEGFFLTGDIGHFDVDGNLYIVDRKKDIIICKGFHISPSEIESYLIESLNIKIVSVVGVLDETANEYPTAFIVRNPNSNITEKDVFDSVAGHFADHFKLRGGVHFVDSLPTTPSGKIMRRKLIELTADLKNAKQ